MVIERERKLKLDLSELDGLVNMRLRGADETTALSSNRARLLALCAVPFACSAGLVMQAAWYDHIIPPGEAMLRDTLMAICIIVALVGIALAFGVLARHWGQRVEASQAELIIHASSGSRAYPWHEVSLGFPRGKGGLRTVTIMTPDGHATMNELLYPGLVDGYEVMTQHAKLARSRPTW